MIIFGKKIIFKNLLEYVCISFMETIKENFFCRMSGYI